MTTIPEAKFALIGGSGTWGARFPEDLPVNAEVVSYLPRFETPYGLSAPFKILDVNGQPVLRVAMHGCYPALPDRSEVINPWVASKQVAWVLKQAGVKYAISEGSVGGLTDKEGNDLTPWTVVIPDDFYMPWYAPMPAYEGQPDKSIYYRMGNPFCGPVRHALAQAARRIEKFAHVLDYGVYACTPLGRFESRFEISRLKNAGATIVGQTVAHEALALRSEGIHFGALNIVSNFAENGTTWIGTDKDAMARFYHECPPYVAQAVVSTLHSLIWNPPACTCDEFELTGLEVFPVDGA